MTDLYDIVVGDIYGEKEKERERERQRKKMKKRGIKKYVSIKYSVISCLILLGITAFKK